MSEKTEIKEYTYTGSLSKVLNKYVAEKRGMGILFNSEAKKLANLDRYTKNFDCKPNTLSKELVIAYTAKTINESNGNHQYRFNLVNRLAVFMQRCGYEAYYQPTNILKKAKDQYIPYIFSNEEIRRFFLAVDSTKSSPMHKNYHLIIPLLFRMLYICGLRSSEVRYLTVGDVDLKNGILTIQGTKFDKDRLVPMSKSLTERCRLYSEQLHQYSDSNNAYLFSAKNIFFGEKRVYDIFREILWKAGISHGGVGKGPRVHDLRHTFAVHCLRKWVTNGVDISVALPYLSAYLGHTGLKSTQKYLRLTSDLYPTISAMLENNHGDIIPSIGGGIDETN